MEQRESAFVNVGGVKEELDGTNGMYRGVRGRSR